MICLHSPFPNVAASLYSKSTHVQLKKLNDQDLSDPKNTFSEILIIARASEMFMNSGI